jgi:cobalt-zinc-cadmium efflux system outer membrane protein
MRAYIARWRVARVGAASLLALTLATACATASRHRYGALQQDWQRSDTIAPAVAEGEVAFAGHAWLERGTLVERVLERNPNVRAARFAWRAALARYPQVTSLEDPMFGAGLAPRSLGSSRVHDAPKYDLSQKLPFPGKLRLRGEAALAEAESASHDYQAVRLRLATMASLVYDDYALATRSLEINRSHIELLGEFQRIAVARYEAGQASQQDPIQAEVELTHAIHREIVLETARRVAAEQINVLMHRRPEASLPPPTWVVGPVAKPPSPTPELVEQALAEKPELAAAAARVSAQQSRVDLAWREYLPDLTLVGSYNRIMQEKDLQPFVGVQLNVPLQLGRRRAALDEAEARLEMARSEQRAIEDDVRLAVQSGLERLGEAHHVEHLFRERLLPAAQDQVDAARAGFETGRNSFLALIDAQRNLLDVELGHEQALADLGRRRAELDRARGRIAGLGW